MDSRGYENEHWKRGPISGIWYKYQRWVRQNDIRLRYSQKLCLGMVIERQHDSMAANL
jgi:hypothetical protein